MRGNSHMNVAYVLCDFRVSVGAGGVQRRPRVRVLHVDERAVPGEDLHHVQVVVQHRLVEGGQTYGGNDKK